MNILKLFLIDDHALFRDSLRVALWKEASIQVVAEAGAARDWPRVQQAGPADLLVIDLMLEDGDGMSLVRELAAGGSDLRIMILSAHDNEMFVRDAFEAGAQGYALKEQPLSEIIEGIRQCARGEKYVFPRFGPVPAMPPAGGGGASALGHLSPREREIVGLVLQGHSSQAIARDLHISLKTVETHRSHINRKLSVHSPAELIRAAALKGLLPPQTTR